MKASEIRELSMEDIRGRVLDIKEELFNLRFQHGIGQLENPRKIKQTKRELARMTTVIREIELKNTDKE